MPSRKHQAEESAELAMKHATVLPNGRYGGNARFIRGWARREAEIEIENRNL
jgi:hypothetical protein